MGEVLMQHGQAIRLVEVRGDLGEPTVRGIADGTRDVIAHDVTEAVLDLVREGRKDIAGRHCGGQFVHGAHGMGSTSRTAATMQWWTRV